MSDSPVAQAYEVVEQALAALSAAAGPAADDADLLAVLTVAEGVSRRLEHLTAAALVQLERRGTFAERGYRSTPAALADLLGLDRVEGRRRVLVAEQTGPRIGLDGAEYPPRLAATAAVFAAAGTSARHVEVIARLLDWPAAGLLSPTVWAGAEQQLAAWAAECPPAEVQARGAQMLEALDADGPEPDDEHRAPVVNELTLRRHRDGRGGGTLHGRYDDAAMFDAIAAMLDAQSVPAAGDERTPPQRRAHALADACGYVLEHGDVPACGGRRPVLNVLIRLEDLEARCRAAVLDFGGRLSPESLRMLACDAAVVPIVLDGAGQPLDVGRATRTIPDGLRRAVAGRDRGCARCGRAPSWCDVHHVVEWQDGGETRLDNLVMVCKACHRLVHHAGWTVTLTVAGAEFRPPRWIDPARRPRSRPLAALADLITAEHRAVPIRRGPPHRNHRAERSGSSISTPSSRANPPDKWGCSVRLGARRPDGSGSLPRRSRARGGATPHRRQHAGRRQRAPLDPSRSRPAVSTASRKRYGDDRSSTVPGR